MSYVYAFDLPHGLPLPEAQAILGGKAANLSVMAIDLGLPVPPGFTITTAACKAYLAGGWPAGLDDEIRAQMRRVEETVGRRFGDALDPLLVSVRSGAPVSMPGMMDTILNLGLNSATAAGLAAVSGDPAFASNCHQRFAKMFREIVGVPEVPEDPWLQLRAAIEAVFRSWNSDRAKTYRSREGIADDLGTAVTVQTMVFGNRGSASATGVMFTRNPATGEPSLYGDVMFDAQGEDVVAGTHRTESLAVLDERLPAVGAELRGYAERLERHYADLCDIEFTVEQGKLWMLQVRVGKRSPQAALRIAIDMAETRGFPLSREQAVRRVAHYLASPPQVTMRDDSVAPLTTGLPASPGVACGAIVTSPDAAEAAEAQGRRVILVRAETSPDDVHGMARAAGVLTSLGGLNSHAAVVARGWAIPAVVGAAGVEVGSDAIVIAGRTFGVGELITIDGGSGEVFAGEVRGRTETVPEAAILLGWARELGIEIEPARQPGEAPGGRIGVAPGGVAPAAAAAPAAPAAPTAPPETLAPPAVSVSDALRALLIKGTVTPEQLTAALLASTDEVEPFVDELKAAGLTSAAAGAVRLTPEGKLRAYTVIEADRQCLGPEVAAAALEHFVALDHRMKDTVTAWQMQQVDGQPVFNDHSDSAYDARVLDQLAALHADTVAWLGPLVARLERLRRYGIRFDRALELARGGDGRYVCSPRVESYHNVWFELHEDLIRLAGRTRAEETAAGRA